MSFLKWFPQPFCHPSCSSYFSDANLSASLWSPIPVIPVMTIDSSDNLELSQHPSPAPVSPFCWEHHCNSRPHSNRHGLSAALCIGKLGHVPAKRVAWGKPTQFSYSLQESWNSSVVDKKTDIIPDGPCMDFCTCSTLEPPPLLPLPLPPFMWQTVLFPTNHKVCTKIANTTAGHPQHLHSGSSMQRYTPNKAGIFTQKMEIEKPKASRDEELQRIQSLH